MTNHNDLVVIAGRAGKQFAQKVIREFSKLKDCPVPDLTLGEVDIIDFPNGELSARLNVNLRKKAVHVFQSIILGKNRNIFKDFLKYL